MYVNTNDIDDALHETDFYQTLLKMRYTTRIETHVAKSLHLHLHTK